MNALLLGGWLHLACAATPALKAAPALGEAPRYVLSLEVPSLLWDAVELDGERYFDRGRFSGVAALGARFAGQGDFSSATVGAGVGARYWLGRFQLPFMRGLGGPEVGLRFDFAITRVAPHSGGSLSSVDTAVSARAGYRFVIVRRVEITPEAGLALTTGLDRVPQLVGVPRLSGVFALTMGYLFRAPAK